MDEGNKKPIQCVLPNKPRIMITCKHCGKEIETDGSYPRSKYLHKKCYYIRKFIPKERKKLKEIPIEETELFDVDKYASLELFPPGYRDGERVVNIKTFKVRIGKGKAA